MVRKERKGENEGLRGKVEGFPFHLTRIKFTF